MSLTKRKYRTKDGKLKTSPNWSYEFEINGRRFAGTISGLNFATKTKAKEEIQKLKKRKEKEIEGKNNEGRIPFSEALLTYYEDYVAGLDRRIKESPHKRIQDRWLYIIDKLQIQFEGLFLDEIDDSYIVRLITQLRRKGLKNTGIANYVDCLQVTFNHAKRQKIIKKEAVPDFPSIKKIISDKKKRTRTLSTEEYDRLISQYATIAERQSSGRLTTGRYSSKNEDSYITRTRRRMVIFNVETGLRAEEMLSLRVSDIDFKDKEIFLAATKNGDSRYISLSKIALEMAIDQIEDYEKNNITNPDKNHVIRFVFCKRDGSKYQNFRKGFDADVKRANLKDVHIHDLRRTFGTWRLQGIRGKKLSMEQVRTVLGHRSMATTQSNYAFLDQKKIKL